MNNKWFQLIISAHIPSKCSSCSPWVYSQIRLLHIKLSTIDTYLRKTIILKIFKFYYQLAKKKSSILHIIFLYLFKSKQNDDWWNKKTEIKKLEIDYFFWTIYKKKLSMSRYLYWKKNFYFFDSQSNSKKLTTDKFIIVGIDMKIQFTDGGKIKKKQKKTLNNTRLMVDTGLLICM
jgi:hypothetical protein